MIVKVNFHTFQAESEDEPVRYGLSETGEIFLRGIMAAPAVEVLMRAGYKSVIPVEHQGEFYFPLSWLRQEYPEAVPLWRAFEQKITDRALSSR